MRLFSHILPYLLLVTFSSGQVRGFDTGKIEAVNASPYNGVAIALIDAYATGKFTEKDFESAIKVLKKGSKKHIWPWVFFNRFVGYKEGEKTLSAQAEAKYFRDIRGMDIYNETGALQDFYDLWRVALKSARALDAPGIVVDPETYNNYKNYQLSYLARQLGKPEAEVKERLIKVGAELVDIAEKEYPDATLWFLFTGLGTPEKTSGPSAQKEYRTVSYIIQGMLERTKERKSRLKIVSGGEISPGYCSPTLEDLKKKISKRNADFAPAISLYPNLHLGGTISPWDNAELKKAWMLQGQCGRAEMKSIADFKPFFRQLLSSYDYVWIYAASAAGYDPYDSRIYPAYNKALEEAIHGSR